MPKGVLAQVPAAAPTTYKTLTGPDLTEEKAEIELFYFGVVETVFAPIPCRNA